MAAPSLVGEAQQARIDAQRGVKGLMGDDVDLLTPREIASRIRVIADYLPIAVAALEEVLDEMALRQRDLSAKTGEAWNRVARQNHGLDRGERMLAEHQRAAVEAEVATARLAIDLLAGRERVIKAEVRAFENILSAMQTVLRATQEVFGA